MTALEVASLVLFVAAAAVVGLLQQPFFDKAVAAGLRLSSGREVADAMQRAGFSLGAIVGGETRDRLQLLARVAPTRDLERARRLALIGLVLLAATFFLICWAFA